jgi:regulator of nucleoside diphosphate kinase
MHASPSINVSAQEITVTTQDLRRLQDLLTIESTAEAEQLDIELARANVVAETEIGRDVVTMNSDVTYEERGTGTRRTVRIVYPRDANAARGWISVLAPLGSALLGLKVGQEIEWRMPSGLRRVRVLAVPYQPEANGDFEL